MSIDQRLIPALQEILPVGNTHQRAYLIGGQALRDLATAWSARIGLDLPSVRASEDIDVLLSVGNDADADRALAGVLRDFWSLKPDRPATYCWRRDPSVELELATTYGPHDQPARAVRISMAGTGRILAYRMLPLWLHDLNLIEPCSGDHLRRIGLERLRHTALLISKVLAVDATLTAMAMPAPPGWVTRLDRDLGDILLLTDRRVQPGLWCVASTAKRSVLEEHIGPVLERLIAWAGNPPAMASSRAREQLRMVTDGHALWWRRRHGPGG